MIFCRSMIILSIHDLPRRSTAGAGSERGVAGLSIHDLPRRSTSTVLKQDLMHQPFNSRPPEEVDWKRGWTCWKNRYFQFTTSRGGRQADIHLFIIRKPFNSRPPEEVDTDFAAVKNTRDVFQFTTSRGGRPRTN